jgi:hypothetical protein
MPLLPTKDALNGVGVRIMMICDSIMLSPVADSKASAKCYLLCVGRAKRLGDGLGTKHVRGSFDEGSVRRQNGERRADNVVYVAVCHW